MVGKKQGPEKEINLLAIGLTVLAAGIALIAGSALLPDGEEKGGISMESVATEAPAATEMQTVETETPEPRYEKQTVYLCVGYTTTQTDGSGSKGYTYEYDEYGRATSMYRYYNGVPQNYRLYYYDDETGEAYVEYYSEEGELKTTNGASINGPTIELGGMPEVRHGTYVYNDDGYIIAETNADGKVLYSREYNADYNQMTEIGYPDDESKRFLSREATLDAEGNLLTEIIYTEDGDLGVSKVYSYDDQGRVVRIDNDIPGGHMPLNYPWLYEYDEHGNLVFFDVDYYYGYETEYQYEAFDIWVAVE